MSVEELEKIIDKVRDDLISRHPLDEDAIDLTSAMILYELRKRLNNKEN